MLDPFDGSGTTLAVAQKLGRRWVGCDAGYGAIQTARRRLYAVLGAQAAAPSSSPSIPPSSPHAACGFAIYGAAALPSDLPRGDDAPQLHLTITAIPGDAARIRVAVERATWPAAQAGAPDPADWRTAIDEVAIDPDYDGCTLRVRLADAPLKRKTLVAGEYIVPAPPPGAQVAVRVTDIWGREAVVKG